MRGWFVGITAVMLAMTPALAQQQNDADQFKARQRISVMEGVLEKAVSSGAESMMRQFKTVSPDLPMLTGLPEARGFRLEGYGVFFDVEVPGLVPPVTWPLRQLYRDSQNRAVDELRALMVTLNDPRQRDQVSEVVRQLELLSPSAANARAVGQNAGPLLVQRSPDPGVIEDPEAKYTQEVKSALVDAMIENSGPLAIGNDEWLTVAARDNVPVNPLVPDRADFSTLIIRVKGTDLAAYRAGRITLDDVRKKVEVKEN
jgi:hypothetical protein